MVRRSLVEFFAFDRTSYRSFVFLSLRLPRQGTVGMVMMIMMMMMTMMMTMIMMIIIIIIIIRRRIMRELTCMHCVYLAL